MKSLKPKQHKTTFIGYVATSIDGRISLSKTKAPDWTSKEDWKFFQKKLANAEAVITGYNTYVAAQAHLMKRTTYVFSHRVMATKGSVTFINPSTIGLKKYFSSHKTVAIVGGALVYQTMLDAGLLDELYVTIEPLIFGRGTEMFIGGTKTSRFNLVSTRRLNAGGTLLLHYSINNSKKR